MATNAMNRLILHLRRVALRQDGAGLTDGELLEQYVTRRDEAAFEALLRRHGPMVLGVCRRVLRNETDAEDAFQATFLVLVSKAASIRSRGTVSNWLYGVAYNTALKAKAMNRKRHVKEREAGTAPKREARSEVWHEVQTLLDAELSKLPDKYRVPIVLCDLEGKTIKEAGRHLGWPQGTVATRLTRGRAQLAKLLTKRGLTLSGGVVAAALSQGAVSANLLTTLIASTAMAASSFVVTGQAAAGGVISAKLIALTEGMMKTLLLTKLKFVTSLVLVLAPFGVGWGVYLTRAAMPEETQEFVRTAGVAPAVAAPAKEGEKLAAEDDKANARAEDTFPEVRKADAESEADLKRKFDIDSAIAEPKKGAALRKQADAESEADLKRKFDIDSANAKAKEGAVYRAEDTGAEDAKDDKPIK